MYMYQVTMYVTKIQLNIWHAQWHPNVKQDVYLDMYVK